MSATDPQTPHGSGAVPGTRLRRVPSVVVTNLGSNHWKHTIADSLAASGQLRSYVTTFVASPEFERRVTRLLPGAIAHLVSRYLRVKRLPSGIPAERVKRVAQPSAVIATAVFRVSSSPRVHTATSTFAAERFDVAAAACLRPEDRVAVVAFGSSLRTIEAAQRQGITTILDYPTVHCDFQLTITQEERLLRPDFAGTMPLVYTGERRQARLRAEIAGADRILVNSSFARDTFLEHGIAEKRILLVYHGVDPEMFRPRDEERPDDGCFRVLFAGRITQMKGIAYLIDAFDRAAIPHAELRFVGKPFGTTDSWRSHPHLYHQAAVPIHELREQYISADVYVLPSLFEGFPHTAIMAMACGLPCIVSEHTFGRDVITDGVDGFVVPIRNVDAIADRLVTLHRDPALRRRMGQAARHRAQQFTWETFGRRIADLISDMGD